MKFFVFALVCALLGMVYSAPAPFYDAMEARDISMFRDIKPNPAIEQMNTRMTEIEKMIMETMTNQNKVNTKLGTA